MNPERINRKFHLKEASKKLISPVKKVVEEAMTKLKDGVSDDFGRNRIALMNDETRRIYFLSDVVSQQKAAERDCGLFIEGIQLGSGRIPESGLPSMQFPVDSSLFKISLGSHKN